MSKRDRTTVEPSTYQPEHLAWLISGEHDDEARARLTAERDAWAQPGQTMGMLLRADLEATQALLGNPSVVRGSDDVDEVRQIVALLRGHLAALGLGARQRDTQVQTRRRTARERGQRRGRDTQVQTRGDLAHRRL